MTLDGRVRHRGFQFSAREATNELQAVRTRQQIKRPVKWAPLWQTLRGEQIWRRPPAPAVSR